MLPEAHVEIVSTTREYKQKCTNTCCYKTEKVTDWCLIELTLLIIVTRGLSIPLFSTKEIGSIEYTRLYRSTFNQLAIQIIVCIIRKRFQAIG